MAINVEKAEFVASAFKLRDVPVLDLPEVALIGRSNVGKSSLINRLTQTKGLARVSNTPGRTQTLNFFKVTLNLGRRAQREIGMVDLPGFGFAKVSKGKHSLILDGSMDYLRNRPNLKLVFLLNDARRMPGDAELYLVEQLFDAGRHLQIILTKSDKLSYSQLQRQTKLISKAYGLEPGDLLVAGQDQEVEDIWQRVMAFLD